MFHRTHSPAWDHMGVWCPGVWSSYSGLSLFVCNPKLASGLFIPNILIQIALSTTRFHQHFLWSAGLLATNSGYWLISICWVRKLTLFFTYLNLSFFTSLAGLTYICFPLYIWSTGLWLYFWVYTVEHFLSSRWKPHFCFNLVFVLFSVVASKLAEIIMRASNDE